MPILYKSKLAGGTQYDIKKNEDWITACEQVKNEFPTLTLLEMDKLIEKGIRGQFDKIQPTINVMTLCRWLRHRELTTEEKEQNFLSGL